jgi:hypothetical protein
MLLLLLYFAVRRLLRLLSAGGDRDDVARDVELLVLRLRVHLSRFMPPIGINVPLRQVYSEARPPGKKP